MYLSKRYSIKEKLSFFLRKETHHLEKQYNPSDSNWGKASNNALRTQDKMDSCLYQSEIPADPVGIIWYICVDMNVPVSKNYRLSTDFIM